MKKFVLSLALVLAASVPTFAATPDLPVTPGMPEALLGQTVAPPQVYIAQHLNWNQAGPDLPTVQGYGYQYFADGATTPTATLSAVTCSGTASPFACVVAVPAFTPGSHSLTLEATDVAGASPASAVLSFTFVVAPAAPIDLVIKH